MIKLLEGIIIGTCMILPGVSGSVIAIMLGVYEEVIYLINSKENIAIKIKKLFPLSIGIIIGIFIFGKVLLYFYNEHTYYMMYIFMGLILSGIPILLEELIKRDEKINILYLTASLIISIIPKLLNIKIKSDLSFIKLFLGGFLYIGGKIIPGISSSFFLMILGLYDYFLKLVTFDIDINVIPFILGIILGLYIFIKAINYLLTNHFSKTYSTIIGFVIGTVILLYPGFELTNRGIISFILMLISFIFVNKLTKK